MRRWILMGMALLLISWLSPVKGTDVAELQPIELIQVYREKDSIVMATDTGDQGKGQSLKDALNNLYETTAGSVFLETAEYLLLTGETEELLWELSEIVRPAAQVCFTDGPVDTAGAAKYLSSHDPEASVREVRYGKATLPKLRFTEGRFELER